MIREASLLDVLEFLNDRGLGEVDSVKCKTFIVDNNLLVAYEESGPYTCEVHIIIKKGAVRHYSELISEAECYLKLKGFDAMMTAIEPKYTASIKLAERIGFQRIGCYNEQILFSKGL